MVLYMAAHHVYFMGITGLDRGELQSRLRSLASGDLNPGGPELAAAAAMLNTSISCYLISAKGPDLRYTHINVSLTHTHTHMRHARTRARAHTHTHSVHVRHKDLWRYLHIERHLTMWIPASPDAFNPPHSSPYSRAPAKEVAVGCRRRKGAGTRVRRGQALLEEKEISAW